jgi:ATP-dependent DNA ligase
MTGAVRDDPRLAWQPMRPYIGRARPEIRDPVIEPYWSGLRVLAHVGRGRSDGTDPVVRLLIDSGADLAPELADIVAQVAAAVDASEAIIDGIVTRQVGLQGVGAAPVAEVRSSASAILLRNTADIDIVPRGMTADAEDADEGFVAVDLLSVDGMDLLAVPLLERKRLLESVVHESDRVRVSVIARPPIDTWVVTWKALGLRGGLLKAANSRYEPGERSTEWRIVERVGRHGA